MYNKKKYNYTFTYKKYSRFCGYHTRRRGGGAGREPCYVGRRRRGGGAGSGPCYVARRRGRLGRFDQRVADE